MTGTSKPGGTTLKLTLNDGTIGHGEVHWYEAHGIGKKELKLKWFVED